jgi:hypothetical protein
MKLNFNFQLKGLDGKQVAGDDNHAGKVLANALSLSNKGNAIKLYDWALKLFNKQTIEVDDTDFSVLFAFVETSEFMFVICKSQLLHSMNEEKEKAKKKAQ